MLRNTPGGVRARSSSIRFRASTEKGCSSASLGGLPSDLFTTRSLHSRLKVIRSLFAEASTRLQKASRIAPGSVGRIARSTSPLSLFIFASGRATGGNIAYSPGLFWSASLRSCCASSAISLYGFSHYSAIILNMLSFCNCCTQSSIIFTVMSFLSSARSEEHSSFKAIKAPLRSYWRKKLRRESSQ